MSSLSSHKENALVLLGGNIMLFPQFIPTAALSRLKMKERSTSAARFIKSTHFDRVIDILFMLFFSEQSDLTDNAFLSFPAG